jgi:hypothetical protein
MYQAMMLHSNMQISGTGTQIFRCTDGCFIGTEPEQLHHLKLHQHATKLQISSSFSQSPSIILLKSVQTYKFSCYTLGWITQLHASVSREHRTIRIFMFQVGLEH